MISNLISILHIQFTRNIQKKRLNATKIKNNKDRYGGVIGWPIRPVTGQHWVGYRLLQFGPGRWGLFGVGTIKHTTFHSAPVDVKDNRVFVPKN